MYGICIDDPSTFENAPVSIQVVGRTLEEEAVIAISEIVDAAVKSFGRSSNFAASEV
jgi:Asp-tRNA(Asn)/Glu-tRNA(Gln) amidotransferase A subunit family amidase